MLAQAGRVLIEFRIGHGGMLPKGIRKHDRQTETVREKRFELQKGRPVLDRHCVVPSHLPALLEQIGMELVDARYEQEISRKWKVYKIVRFTFETVLPDARELVDADIQSAKRAFFKYARKRWNTAKVTSMQWDTLCIKMSLDSELDHPLDPLYLEDPNAASFGFVVTKSRPRAEGESEAESTDKEAGA